MVNCVTARAVTFRARAPLRLGLAGGGTDLSPYCDKYGGAVLNATIDRYASASLTLMTDPVVLLRADDLDIQEEMEAAELSHVGPLQMHRAVYNRVVKNFKSGRPFGMRLVTMTDAPPGSGLGSSSALAVALVEVFRAALELPLGRYDVAHLAYEIERRDLGLAGGRQDQYAAAFGGLNFIEFAADDRVIVNPLRPAPAIVNELQSSLIICFSGQSRASAQIISDQIGSMEKEDRKVLENLHQLKETARLMKQAILQGDIDRMATLLNESWVAKKATSQKVSSDLLERLWEIGHQNGAKAGKVSGAGGGGFMMFLVDPDRRSQVVRALEREGGKAEAVSLSNTGVEAWQAP